MDEKLKDIGARMDLSEEDIEKVKVQRRVDLFIIILGSVIITLMSGLFGFLMRTEGHYTETSTYPFIGFIALSMTFGQRNNKNLKTASVVTVLNSIMAFIIGYMFVRPSYGIATAYDVYSR